MSPPLKVTIAQLLKVKNTHYDKLVHELSQSTKTGLSELDSWKLNFSNTLKSRHMTSSTDPESFQISKEELLKLIDWKLKKGKFRPTLRSLVNQNSEDTIVSTIQQAFTLFLATQSQANGKSQYLDLVKQTITILVKLRGIGPATASLILSLLNKITNKAPPFFSDEAAMLVLTTNAKLKYNLKEYLEYVDWFYELNGKFQFNNEELEQGVWCLGIGKQLYGEDYLLIEQETIKVDSGIKRKTPDQESAKTSSRSERAAKRRKPN
ncbi:hypothetical protein WICPIJ_000633 [Wickerhamomyces pijperi]|uniref:Uncharacterized protein n=1 Tax=Wickerhamomyces pijperi TaxID=599730 RepID=A0A9P8QG23_WICPI|nr:hypothetical protein WICPIJ_000633 [Wickerhamomyces pijperi]